MRQETYRSPLRWYGGKFSLAKKLVALMPPHECYCEVFGGAGHVLFKKPKARCETLNDIDGELVNFWRQLQANGQELVRRASLALYSRQMFNEYASMDRETVAALDNLERAWRFFYLNRTCFGGMMRSHAFGVMTTPGAMRPPTWPERLAQGWRRLQGVIVEALPWQKCLELYDRPKMLFYLDPPYLGFENDYGKGKFGRQDSYELADRLATLKGKFVLSINDCPEARQIFAGFRLLLEPEVSYSINKKRHVSKGELVLGNFEA